MSNNQDDNTFLKQIMDAELKDPASLARLAAENARNIAVAASKLGSVGEDNTVYSQDMMNATMKQIEQIQKLHGFPQTLPFQSGSYQVPKMMDAPLQNEGEIQSQVSEQEAKAQVANELTHAMLSENGGFVSIPMIGLNISEWINNTRQYLTTNLLAQKAESKAKEGLNTESEL